MWIYILFHLHLLLKTVIIFTQVIVTAADAKGVAEWLETEKSLSKNLTKVKSFMNKFKDADKAASEATEKAVDAEKKKEGDKRRKTDATASA